MFYPDNGSNEPHTHVLIIGVGGYPHIADGESPNDDVTNRFGALTQLTSAPRTAARFAQWVVEKANNWLVPLGSVDVLISPVAGDDFILPTNQDGSALSLPTFENLRQAFLDWKGRCDRNPGNISLFYFCGHGGQRELSLYLLCQDFGASVANIWDGSIDFTKERDAFHACKAERQLFFVDACRELTLGLVLYKPTPRPILQARNETDPECRFNFTLFAAPRNESALGPVRGVSYYAQALMKAMDGLAAKYDNVVGKWVVRTALLVEHLETISAMLELPDDYDPTFPPEINRSTEILQVPRPLIPVRVSCVPDEANVLAKLACQHNGMADDEWPYSQNGGPWNLELPAREFYTAKAEFEVAPFRGIKKTTFFAEPPSGPVTLEVS